MGGSRGGRPLVAEVLWQPFTMRGAFLLQYVDDILLTSESLSSLKVEAHACGSSDYTGMAGECRQIVRTWITYQMLGCYLMG